MNTMRIARAAVAALAFSLVAAACGSAASDTHTPRTHKLSSRAAASTSIESRFAVLRRPRRVSDRLPIAGDGNAYLADYGLTADMARLSQRDGSRGLYLVAGRRNTCLYFGNDKNGGYNCGPNATLAQSFLALAAYLDKNRTTVAHFFPDGVTSVDLIEGAHTRHLRVRDNSVLFHQTGDTAVGQLRWRDPHTRHIRQIDLP